MDSNHFDDFFWQALDHLVQTSTVIIDRPRGTCHPRYPDYIYPVDYGYLRETRSMDGQGIDVWKGTRPHLTCDAVLCLLDLNKRDSEIKILLGCTEEEQQQVYLAQNRFTLRALLIRRPLKPMARVQGPTGPPGMETEQTGSGC